MADLLRFTVPGKPEYVAVVRLAVSCAANTAGFDVEDIEDIKIAVSEVCTNVFCKCENTPTYEIICELGEEGMIISIEDGSMHDADPEKMQECSEFPEAYQRRRGPAELAAGLLMLRALMDEVDIFSAVQERNMLIRMIKHFSRS